MTRPAYEKTLDRLAALLRRKPLTAREIAEALGCCRPTAYQRIRALQERGESVYTIPCSQIPETGPIPVAYGIR